MKIRLALAALSLSALGTTTVLTSAVAEESLDGKATIEGKLDGKSKKLNVTIKGKDANVYVNKDFPLKCTLKIKDGGTLEKTAIAKTDITYEDVPNKTGKAKTAKFTVGADKPVEGECKVVVCSDSACSKPFKVTFTSN